MSFVLDEPGELSESDKLRRRCRSGANWFYWIAGLSVVNSALSLAGSDVGFVVGLGITQVLDAIGKAVARGAERGLAEPIRLIAFCLALLIAGLFVLFGWQAGRQRAWAFLTGMVVYGLDGVLFLLVHDWVGLAFHALALVFVWSGYSSMKRLHLVEAQQGLRPIGPGA